MTSATRDAQGYPLSGEDSVPDKHRLARLKDHMASVMGLLQEANERNEQLMVQLEQWKTDYATLRRDYLALKYGQLCSTCQLQRLSMRDGECVEVTCSQCRPHEAGLKRLLEEEEGKSRFWQGCYESVLSKYYGCQGDVDGADGGLQ